MSLLHIHSVKWPVSCLVSHGQTSISVQGVYHLQYKHPCQKGSGLVHSVDSFLTRSLTFVYTLGAHQICVMGNLKSSRMRLKLNQLGLHGGGSSTRDRGY